MKLFQYLLLTVLITSVPLNARKGKLHVAADQDEEFDPNYLATRYTLNVVKGSVTDALAKLLPVVGESRSEPMVSVSKNPVDAQSITTFNRNIEVKR
jgi:hypothetical protein